MAPTASVVVVNYEGKGHLGACVRAAAAQQGVDVEVIVVDNASSDGSWIEADDVARVSLIRNDRNVGFGAACNQAARVAHGRYLAFLNFDSIPEPDWLARLVEAAEGAGDCGAVQGLVLTGDGGVNTAGNQAQYLGFSWAPLGVAPASTAPYEIPTASGASLLVERELFLQVGGFWEELFLYQEDFDLCWRLRLGGRRIIAAPGARSHHQYEFSRNRGKYYHLERGRHLVLFANYEAGTLLRLAPALLATDLALLAVAARDGWLGEQLSALASVARSLPALARQRRIVQAQRTVRDSEILRVLSSELDQAAFGRVASFAAPYLKRYRALVGLG